MATNLKKILIADNVSSFNAYKFEDFCHKNKIELKHSPVYHPQSNGQTERMVEAVKENKKKLSTSW